MQVTANNIITENSYESLFHYWFVKYNPLYFFSALCVLVGMFIISLGLKELQISNIPLIMSAIVESYQFLLIAGAWLLYRVAGKRRPAVILAIIELVFLFDCVFQTEGLAAVKSVGIVYSMLWMLLFGGKLWALISIFSIHVPIATITFIALAGAGIAVGPHILRASFLHEEAAHLMLTWYGIGLIAAARMLAGRIKSLVPLDEWGSIVLHRVAVAAGAISTVFYFMHLFTWSSFLNIPLGPAYFVSFLVMMIFMGDTEKWTLGFACAAAVFGLLNLDPAFCIIYTLIAGALFIQGYRLKLPRLYIGSVVSLLVFVWNLTICDVWPTHISPLPLVFIGIALLLYLAIVFKLKSAMVTASLIIIAGLMHYVPQTVLGYGVLITAVGFVSLAVGIAINWHH